MEDHCDSLIPSDIGANGCENSLAPSDIGANGCENSLISSNIGSNGCEGHNTPMESGHELHTLNENDVIPPPKIGMIFGSEYEVRSYYTKYANQLGFGIMTRNSRKRRDGKVAYLILACSKEGNRRSNKRSPIRNVASKKQKCEAHINASICKDGGYQIKTVVLKHNHDLHPSKDNVNFDIRVKRTLDLNDQAGLRMNKSFRSPVVEVGGCDKMTFCENNCRDYIQKERKLIGKDGDGDALHKYFVRMQEQNKNFFYTIDMDDCFLVRNVFWADARSIAAYKSFGDVVTVDSTYLTNQYEMPLVAFVGVNHHGQSILFGCGLLSCEETESFVWLFQSWLQCMSGVAPKGVITDQCRAMQNAIKIVFPLTKHRWCLWHIMKKLPQKIRAYAGYKSIGNHLQSAIYDTLTTNEFESYWKKSMEEFGLENNEWLKELFLERHRWVPTFVKGHFWAGMSTTQRNESVHAFFNGYVNRKTTLKQFVEQYDNALLDKAEKEFEADFRSFSGTHSCATNSPFERQYQSAYTHAKFLEIREEFTRKADCNVRIARDEGSICHYNIIEDMMIGDTLKEAVFEVTFDRVNCDIECTCRSFEFKGILCRHSLAILSLERVKEVPCKYILDRWRKNLKRRHTCIKSSYCVKQLKPQMERFDLLCKQFDDVAEVAAEFEETSSFVKGTLCELKQKLEAWANCLRNSYEVAIPISSVTEGWNRS